MEKIVYRDIVFNLPDYDDRNINRAKTAKAIKNNLLQRKTCEICNDHRYKADAHHEKYADYMNVRWLCKPHHKIVHGIFDKIKGQQNYVKFHERLAKQDPLNVFALKITLRDLDNLYNKYRVS